MTCWMTLLKSCVSEGHRVLFDCQSSRVCVFVTESERSCIRNRKEVESERSCKCQSEQLFCSMLMSCNYLIHSVWFLLTIVCISTRKFYLIQFGNLPTHIFFDHLQLYLSITFCNLFLNLKFWTNVSVHDNIIFEFWIFDRRGAASMHYYEITVFCGRIIGISNRIVVKYVNVAVPRKRFCPRFFLKIR